MRKKTTPANSRISGPSPDRVQIRPQPGPTPSTSYPRPIDAVVLAGSPKNERHHVLGRNKAFLEVDGKPLVRRVVDALLRAGSIDRIFVVGPLPELVEALGGQTNRLRLVEQAGTMLKNAWAGFQASERLRATELPDPVRPVLFTSCDLPFISGAAVDDFVARCAAEDARDPAHPFAFLAGTAEEASLIPYYPQGERPGIVRPYVEVLTGRYRVANIYVARPHAMANREILQAGFSHRKAKDWSHVFGLAWTFFRQPGGWRGARTVLSLQAARLASRYPGRIYRALRRRNDRAQIESIASLILGGALRFVDTPFGGLSIDIDDEHDYRVVVQRFAEWAEAEATATGTLLA